MRTKLLVGSALGLLAALAVVQATIAWNRTRWQLPEGPALGEMLPALETVALETGEPIPVGNAAGTADSCTVVVAISTSCSVCLAMRDQWSSTYSAWHDSVEASIRVTWIAAADSGALLEFYSGHDLSGVRKARMRSDDVAFRNSLGVYATPTVYLLDRQDRLRTGSLGFNLPPADSATRACQVPA